MGIFMKLSDLKKPRNKQELRIFFKLCIQLLPSQYKQLKLLHEIQAYKTVPAKSFNSEVFAFIRKHIVEKVQRDVW